MKNKFKQLGKDSFIYGFGGILSKGIGFFLLPIYTRIFSPADYGIIEMLTVLNGFLSFIIGMGLDSAQSFYFFEQKAKGRKEQTQVISSIFQWRLVWGTLIVICATLLSPLFNHFFFNGLLRWEYFAIAFTSSLLSQFLNQSTGLFRLLYKPWKFILITISNTTITAGAILFLTLVLDSGVIGFFIGSLVGLSISSIIGWYYLKEFLDFSHLQKFWWPRLLKFGAPLVPAGISMYILNTSDRLFINYFLGQSALGIYAIGSKFALIAALAVNTFRLAWWPIALETMQTNEGPSFFRTIARFYLGIGASIIVILTLISPTLVKFLTAPSYFQAYPIVGVLSWSALFYGFGLIAVGGIWKKEKTFWSPILLGFAALLNILLNSLLIPMIGLMGAAIATSISFFVWNLLLLIVSERLWHVNYPILIMLIQVLVGIIATGFILFNYSNDQPLYLTILPATILAVFLLVTSLSKQHILSAKNSIFFFLGKR